VVSGRYSPEDRERHPESEWIVTRDAHPAIVDRATFRRCQEILSRNAKWTTRVRTDWIVSGLVSCPCGKPYVAGGSNMNKRHQATRSYRCVSKADQHTRCAFPGSIKKEWLERTIVETVASIVGGPSQRKRIAQALDRVLAETKPTDALAGIVAQLGDATAARDRLVDAVASGTLTPEEARSRLADARLRIGRLEAQQVALRPANADALKAERDTLLAGLLDFREAALTLKGPALRELLRPWIQSATFDPGTRVLDLAIPHIPLSGFGDLAGMACPPDQNRSSTWHTRRRVKVGP
jgi:hypothetical protein